MNQSPMTIRPAAERGVVEHGWLSSRFTFSFADYHDPRHMGYRALRVINDDRIQPGQGFGMHPHRDMEIISVVVEGALEHKDSLGTGSVIRPGEVQRMTAGTGVMHSEFNPSADEEVRLLQIWIQLERMGLEPGYEQRAFDLEAHANSWVLIASRDGRNGSMTVHQDVALWRAQIGPGAVINHRVGTGRHFWLQVISGAIDVAGKRLQEGDGAALTDPETLVVKGIEDATDVLLFDLA